MADTPTVSGAERRIEAVARSASFRNIRNAFGLRNKAVLDIGCSYGEFLMHFGKGSTGVTVTPEEAEYATAHGLDVRIGNIEADDFVLEKQYDVIFANNIFEHLYSPHHFLVKSKKFLKEGGLLILGVPCVPKIEQLLNVPKFRGSLAVEHINFFTKRTLRYTVERGGWNVHDVRGFHFASPLIDHVFDLVYPHFYVMATPDPHFVYPDRRLKELLGYTEIISEIPGMNRQ